MADIFDKTTKILLKSKNTPDYLEGGKLYEAGRFIINPAFVPDCESKYIIIEHDDTIREMTVDEKTTLAYQTESTIYLITEKQLLINKNGHEYEDNTDTIINPVMPACDIKYTKVVSGNVVEMTTEEKTVVDAPEIEREQSVTNVKEMYLTALDQLDTIINFSDPTNAQVVSAVKTEAMILKKLMKYIKLNVIRDD